MKAKFTLDPKPRSAFDMEQSGGVMRLWCSLCKFSREININQAGSIREQQQQFVADHKRTQKQCKGKQ